ncbi:hypothetical protein NC653_034830 [Populus alba x Populus x berolinensis]|uniref:Uncharacterized protein n=1 Tax=Populus alba x Populus x berolinensis TaxID=444605 RepID=A0AAD6PWH6_9ROSI|nr:hypothetical protein NC653_034830 [Populus alba x Populus x berolinensis]
MCFLPYQISFKDNNSHNPLFLQEDMMPGNQHLQSPSLLHILGVYLLPEACSS